MLDRNFVINLSYRDTDMNYYILHLYNIPVQINAKTIVELGQGQSTYALCAAANKTQGEFYSFDMGPNGHLRLYPEGEGILEQEPRYHFEMIKSQEAGRKWNKPIDFLLHDTSHRYEETKEELELWPKWIRKRGVYVMHDTGHEAGDGMGCRKALDEWYLKNMDNWTIVHLQDPKIVGMSILIKI